jgi:TolB-like protein/class 3 adenylate cyclase/rhodanese-related sulfurtransferase
VAEDRAERRLTTILAADVVGYSRLMAADEAGTLTSLKALRRELIEPKTAEYHGRVVKLMGDGTLMEFGSVVDAVAFAVEVQRAMAERNAKVPEDRQITYRIGINIGDIIVEGDDIYGDGVNVAARLEGLADPGGICISRPVHTQVKGKIDLGFEDLGAQEVKNIPERVQVFKVRLDTPVTEPVAAVSPVAKRSLFRRLAAGGLAVLVIAGGIALWQRSWEPREEPASVADMAFPLPDKPSIAVLPFTNMSGDPEQDYFADGMTEDLITDLSKVAGLFVIARNSSFSYKGQQVKVRQVAEELGVRYVLEGSVRRAGDQVRINAQLIDATTGGHVWADRYDGTIEDIFALQDQVTQQIVTALAVSLTDEEEAQQTRHDTDNAEAHDAYLQGWAHYKLQTPTAFAAAIPFFEEALQLDPNYARAHAALALLYWDAFQNDWAFDLGMPSSRTESRANEHLEEALKEPTPLAHALKARILAFQGFYENAVSEAEIGIALDANDATAYEGLANALILAERPAEGADFIRQAMRLDPHYPPSYLITLGRAQFQMERFDDAAATFNRAVKRNIDNDLPWIYLAATYGHIGRIREGDSAIEAANKLRNQAGMIDVSLRALPYHRKSDFNRFGGKPEQERVHLGLSVLPALSWTTLVTGHGSGAYVAQAFRAPAYEVEGAAKIDVPTARSLYDRRVVFVDVRIEFLWNEGRIPGAFHLPEAWPRDPAKARLSESTLMAIAGKTDDVVFYCDGTDCYSSAFASAKALAWGYQNVFYFAEGFPGWKKAGYPVRNR